MSTTTAASPFHVLFFPGGDKSPQHEEGDKSIESVGLDDYLSRRNEFRKKAASRHQSANAKVDMAVAPSVPIRTLASPLEIAMAACCERVSHEGSDDAAQSSSPQHSRHRSGSTGLHRPIQPSNYTDEDSPPTQLQGSNRECTEKASGTKNASYILQSGKEGHFVKLLFNYCPKDAVGHRALAVAILQRTVDWEVSSLTTKATESKDKERKGQSPAGVQLGDVGYEFRKKFNSGWYSGKVVEVRPMAANGYDRRCVYTDGDIEDLSLKDLQRLAELDPDSTYEKPNVPPSATQHEPKVPGGTAKRAESFLAVGGMKVMERWLVDSYTAVPVPSSDQRKQLVVASPTGCLLLPLLTLLKSLPFNKDIVVASHIHKSIKRLKKALDRLAEGLDPDTLGKVTHPIAGGLSVGKVRAAVDAVMATWNKAASAENDIQLKFDPFEQMQKKIQLRFDDLVRFQHGEGDAPVWLPKSISGLRAPKALHVANKPTNSTHALHTSYPVSTTSAKDGDWYNSGTQKPSPDSQPKAGTLQGLISMKRKGADSMMLVTNKPGKMQKTISWADRPTGNNIPPRPLKEERIFVREAEEMQDFDSGTQVETTEMQEFTSAQEGTTEMQESVTAQRMEEEEVESSEDEDDIMEDLF